MELLCIGKAVAVHDIVEENLGLPSFLHKGADGTMQVVVFGAKLASVLVPSLHQSAKRILKGPTAALFGALTHNGHASHADKAAGDFASFLIEHLGEASGQIAFRAHCSRLAASVVGDHADR